MPEKSIHASISTVKCMLLVATMEKTREWQDAKPTISFMKSGKQSKGLILHAVLSQRWSAIAKFLCLVATTERKG